MLGEFFVFVNGFDKTLNRDLWRSFIFYFLCDFFCECRQKYNVMIVMIIIWFIAFFTLNFHLYFSSLLWY